MIVPAQQLVVLAWIAEALTLIGLGALFRRVYHAPATAPEDLLLSFWVGWAGLVLGLQLWHFVLPVDWRAAPVCVVVGGAGLIAGGYRPWLRLLRRTPRNGFAVVCVVVTALWLSNRALGGPSFGDTGAYFIPTLRWLVEYPIVPGLGNLHAHYALNQSYFLYVAALEVGPFVGRSFHLANGLLVLALASRVALAFGRLLRLRRSAGPVDLYYALLLPGVLLQGVSVFLTSASPDLAVFVLGAVVAGELAMLVAGDPRRRDFHLYTVALLAFTGVTAKLSFAGMAVALLPVALLLWLRGQRPTAARAVRAVSGVALLGGLAIAPWIGRNIIMSGCPLFPSLVAALPVEWRVGTDLAGWVRDTAPVADWSTIFRNPRWYLQSLGMRGWSAADVIGPLGVTLGAAVWGLVRRATRGRTPAAFRLPVLIVLPAVVSLVFCLRTAPTPRFVGAALWVLAAQALVIAIGGTVLQPRSRLRPLVVASILGAAGVYLTTAGASALRLTGPLWLPLKTFSGVPLAHYEAHRLETGLVVNYPRQTHACWAAPLPCTPYPNPALRLRRAEDLGAGFMLDPVLDERYRYDPRRPVRPQEVGPGGSIILGPECGQAGERRRGRRPKPPATQTKPAVGAA